MTLPSSTLLAQSVLSGVFIGGAVRAARAGPGPVVGPAAPDQPRALRARVPRRATSATSWPPRWGIDPLLTLLIVPPLFFVLGVAHAVGAARFQVSAVQLAARHLRPDGDRSRRASRASGPPTSAGSSRPTPRMKFTVGALYVPVPELLTLLLAVGAVASRIWAALRYTDLGKALRAMAEDGPIAAAFGVNQHGAVAAAGRASARRSPASPACASR